MMHDTPKRNTQTDPNKVKDRFSPVQLPESPAQQSPQKNLTGLPRVARDIAADVYNNIQKWNDQHNIGAKLVRNIAIIKSNSTDPFPAELEPLLKDLYDAVQNMYIYVNALDFLSTQMGALFKLHKEQAPLFVSLNAGQLSDLVSCIADSYKIEFSTKQYVLENIAHSTTKEEAMFHAARWTHQQNITSNIILKLETLLIETGHRKVS